MTKITTLDQAWPKLRFFDISFDLCVTNCDQNDDFCTENACKLFYNVYRIYINMRNAVRISMHNKVPNQTAKNVSTKKYMVLKFNYVDNNHLMIFTKLNFKISFKEFLLLIIKNFFFFYENYFYLWTSKVLIPIRFFPWNYKYTHYLWFQIFSKVLFKNWNGNRAYHRNFGQKSKSLIWFKIKIFVKIWSSHNFKY